MSELEIKNRELDEKMTAIADGIRELSGDTALKGLDDMAQGAQTANAEIADQEELLVQVALALENKVSGYERGKKEGFAEALDKRTDLVVTANGEYTPSEDSTGFKSVSVNVASNVSKLADGSITEITAEELQGITTIRRYAFYQCFNLESVKIPKSVTLIDEYAFEYSGITGIVLPNELSQIAYGAFRNCSKLVEIIIPDSVTSVGDYSFAYCTSLERATLPPLIKSIASGVFNTCRKLEDILIPTSVTRIGSFAFSSCSGFKSIIIPEGVASIASSAFSYCTGIKLIKLKPKTPPSIQSNTFQGVPNDCVYMVGYGCGDAYKSATNWSAIANQIVEGDV